MRTRQSELRTFFLFPDVTIMLILFLMSLIVSFLHAAHWSTWIAYLCGMAGYSLSEYTTHRFFFHMKAPKNRTFLRFLKRIHYDHHMDPTNLHLLFLPIWYSVPNMVIFSGVVFLVTRNLVITISFLSGIMFFLLLYEWTHFVAHRSIRPLTNWGRWMKKVHMWHHYKNENYWYGVTHPGFDYLWGTFRDEKTVEKSRTAKHLEQKSSPLQG